MDVLTAVKDQAQYPAIVAWFKAQGELDTEKLALLAEVTAQMSDQIYEHYRAMCDLLKKELMRIRRQCRENGCDTLYPDRSEREKLAYAAETACRLRAVLPEKYEELLQALRH